LVAIVDRVPDRDHDPALTASAMSRKFGELYVLNHSDLIACVNAVGVDDVLQLGIGTAAASRIVRAELTALPSLFDQVEIRAQERAPTRAVQPTDGGVRNGSLLTIVVTLRGSADGALDTLRALDRQTCSDFSVVAVDSGVSSGSVAALDQFIEQRRQKGFRLRRAPHVAEAHATALAAQDASTQYLMFLDSDDVPEPHLVERLLEAIRHSDDDLLEVWSREVDESGEPSEGALTSIDGVVRASYGVDPIAILNGTYDGSPTYLIRKAVLDAVGGYPEGLVAGYEREALALRAALAGYRTEVFPEVLNTRRVTGGRDADDILSTGYALRAVFDQRLNTINFQSSAMAFQSVVQQLQDAERVVEARKSELARRFPARGTRDRLRLLMVISSFPYPPMTGCLLRWWAMIRFLGERHDLTLVTFCTAEDSLRRHELLRYCRSVYAAEPGGGRLPETEDLPHLVRARLSVNMRDALRAIPSEFYDVALIEQIFLAPFRAEINAPIVLGEHNIESRLLAQIAKIDQHGAPTPSFSNPEREFKLMRDYEDRVWPQFRLRTAVNPEERAEIQQRAKGRQTILVENGTNPDLWLPDRRTTTDRIIFFGMLGYYPNIDGLLYFWHEIRPHLVRRRPSIELIATGSAATNEVRALAKEPGFTLVENPADIRGPAMMASVSIVPLRLGSGTRLKILDSFALGLPTVSTTLGCAGLVVEDGVHLLVRDDAAAFADAVDQLLRSADLRQKLRRNGKAIVEERYEWKKVLAPLESALWNVAS